MNVLNSTTALLHSTSFYHDSSWLYLTLLHSILACRHCTWLYSHFTMTLFDFTWLYITPATMTVIHITMALHHSTSLYITLTWLSLLHSISLYHGSTSLYYTLFHSTIALLPLLQSTCNHDSSSVYHDSILQSTMSLLQSTMTLLQSTMTLLHSILKRHPKTGIYNLIPRLLLYTLNHIFSCAGMWWFISVIHRNSEAPKNNVCKICNLRCTVTVKTTLKEVATLEFNYTSLRFRLKNHPHAVQQNTLLFKSLFLA